MMKLALLLGLVIGTVAASTAYATPRGQAGSPPAPRPGEVLIESEPGVYIDAPSAVRETTHPATARPAAPERLTRPQYAVSPEQQVAKAEAQKHVTRPQYAVSPEQQVAKAEAQKQVTQATTQTFPDVSGSRAVVGQAVPQ